VVPGQIKDVGDGHNGERSEKGATESVHRGGASREIWIGHGFSLQVMAKEWDPGEEGALEGTNQVERRTRSKEALKREQED